MTVFFWPTARCGFALESCIHKWMLLKCLYVFTKEEKNKKRDISSEACLGQLWRSPFKPARALIWPLCVPKTRGTFPNQRRQTCFWPFSRHEIPRHSFCCARSLHPVSLLPFFVDLVPTLWLSVPRCSCYCQRFLKSHRNQLNIPRELFICI